MAQLCLWTNMPFWVRRLSTVWVRVFCAPKVTILLVYIPAKIKMSFIWKDIFLPKSASSVSRSQAHLAKRKRIRYTTIFVRRKDQANYLSNHTWAKCYHSRHKHKLKKKLAVGPYIMRLNISYEIWWRELREFEVISYFSKFSLIKNIGYS